MRIVKYINKKINIFKNLRNILKVLSLIEISGSDSDIVMTIPTNVSIVTKGNVLIYSKDGVLITKHKRTHINPEIEIDIKENIDVVADRALAKRVLLGRMALFNNLLKHNRIKEKNKDHI